MMTKSKVSGACPTFFRAACREASRGGPECSYKWVAHTLIGSVANLIDQYDDDERYAKLQELSRLLWGTGERVRGLNVFLASADADEVIGWFKRELPRCMALVPSRRYRTFLEGAWAAAVEEEIDVTVW